MSNPKNVNGDKISFEMKWTFLLGNLTSIALKKEYSDPTALYGAGERSFGTYKLYGMMQCTRDVSKKGCEAYLAYHLVHFQDCLRPKRGGRVLGRRCSFRFELYPFVSNSLKM
ncbi:unnamed protein product [Arabis nemorensis]|uniref:Gnk2-homologous domain-containing protein n=1 Tax=Arabis nemorensis TaxID=586526 RepID=A0A565BBS7_9BRAS|nr:unnamed protein product [Arabis nemorensis]